MRKNSSLGRLGAGQFRKIWQSPALFQAQPATTTIKPIDRQSFAAPSHKSLEEVCSDEFHLPERRRCADISHRFTLD